MNAPFARGYCLTMEKDSNWEGLAAGTRFMRNILRMISALGMAAGTCVIIDLASGPSGLQAEGVGSVVIVTFIFTLACFVVFRLCKTVEPKNGQ